MFRKFSGEFRMKEVVPDGSIRWGGGGVKEKEVSGQPTKTPECTPSL